MPVLSRHLLAERPVVLCSERAESYPCFSSSPTLDAPVDDYLARQQRAQRGLDAERERRDEELYRRVGLPPFA